MTDSNDRSYQEARIAAMVTYIDELERLMANVTEAIAVSRAEIAKATADMETADQPSDERRGR